MAELRKLAAILCSDVVGYSRLAGADEDRVLARLRALRSDLIDPTIAVHHGRVVKRTGDGALVEFRSVVDAVRCAIEIQNAMIERNSGVSEDRRIAFRIGIHIGDVVEESDGDLMGDGVNIAARLEGVAKPGAICLSEDAFRQVRGRLDLAVTDLGLTALKNIAEPVRAYSVEVGVPALAKAAMKLKPPELKKRSILAPLVAGAVALIVIGGAAWYFFAANLNAPIASPEAAHLSIVVLPFANLSNDPAQDYFADGITENLTTDISRIRGSFVIARASAFSLKGKAIDAREIGKALGVRYVLEGSVQRDQNRIRINAQLIDAKTDGQLWAERFDKPLADVFAMQDEIVAALASQLGAELIADEARRAEREINPNSMDLYFQGMAWLNKGLTAEYMERARGFFERALALDPKNLDAFLGVAYLDVQTIAGYRADNRGAAVSAVEAKLTKALSLSPGNAWAHYLMCRVLVNSKRQVEGIAECNRALQLNPNLATAQAMIGFAELVNGHAEKTESHELDAMRVSPRDTEANVWLGYLAESKQFLSLDEDAVTWYRRSLEINGNRPVTYFYLASALAQLGRLEEASSAAQAGLALDPLFTLRRYNAGAQSDNPIFLKQRERIIEGMRRAGIPEG